MSKLSQKCNKKALQAITKAEYHIQNLKYDQNQTPDQNNNQLKYFSGLKYLKHFTISQQFQGQQVTNGKTLIDSLKKLYLTHNATKINQNVFVKTHSLRSSYLPIYEQFCELIQIYHVQKQVSLSYEVDHKQKKSYIRITQRPSFQQKNQREKINQIYVIHHCNIKERQQENPLLKWENFVQKYQFKKEFDQNKNAYIDKIIYNMIFSYVSKSSSSFHFLKINPSSSNIVKNFLLSYFDQKLGNDDQIKKLQSYMFQYQKMFQQKQQEIDLQMKKLPCYSAELKRQKSIPAQYFMAYKKLKEQLYKIYAQVNKQFIKNGIIVDPQMKFQNATCRFMIQHDYNVEKARQKMLQYIKRENQLRTKYSMKIFQKYVDMDILVHLGFDKVGRPVALFKTYNFFADKVVDIKQYCNFCYYFLVIHLMEKTRGYLDDLIVLGDARNNTSRNFKLEVNKEIIHLGVSILPRQFFRIIIFGNNTFSYYIYKIVQPWLPKYANETIQMYKQNFSDVKQSLLKHMDNDCIPQILGGTCTICNDQAKSQMTTRRQMDQSLPQKIKKK